MEGSVDLFELNKGLMKWNNRFDKQEGSRYIERLFD